MGPGWLVDLVVQDPAGIALPLLPCSGLVKRLDELFPELDLAKFEPAIANGEGGYEVSLSLLCAQLTERLIAPVQLDSCVVPSAFRPDIESHLLRGPLHDLVGTSLQLAVRILVWTLEIRDDATALVRAHLAAEVQKLARLAGYLSRHALTNAVVSYAHQRDLAVWQLAAGVTEWPILQLGTGHFSRLVCSTACDSDSFFAAHICRQKAYTNQVLSRLGFPVPRQCRLPLSSSQVLIQSTVKSIGYPCVVKPCDAEQGRGVTIGITNLEGLQQALLRAKAHTDSELLVEQHVEGAYHRMVVIASQLVRVLRLEPPFLIGDGSGTVAQLLDQANSLRLLDGAEEYISRPVELNDAVLGLIASQGFVPEDVLPVGTRVVLSADLENRSNWVYSEWLDRVHPSLVQMAVAIAETLGISNVGVDIISTDITRPLQLGGTMLIELNAIQTLNPRWGATLVDRLLPPAQICHIPLRVVICVAEADWPSRSWIEQALEASPGYALAFPRRLASLVDVETLSCQWTVIPYSHPRQPLMNRSLLGLLFLLDWREFLLSGLPVAQGLQQIELWGSLPIRQASQWQSFCAGLGSAHLRSGVEGLA